MTSTQNKSLIDQVKKMKCLCALDLEGQKYEIVLSRTFQDCQIYVEK